MIAVLVFMPRKRVDLKSIYPYSITARCVNKDSFPIPIEEVWKIMEDYLYLLHHGFGFKIKLFVLMTNHFHLVVQTPKYNLSEGMNYFMRETSKQISLKSGRINQVYGSRFYRTIINTNHYYSHAYKYIYRNPIEAGLSKNVIDYKFSTLNRLLGKNKLTIPLDYDDLLFESFEETLSWLNTAPSQEDYESVRQALTKKEFKLAKKRSNGKPSNLESEKY